MDQQEQSGKTKIDLITKLTLLLFGIFLTSVIFAFSIKALGEIGIYLALLVCGGISAFAIIYFKHHPRLRLIVYGMIAMLTLAIIILIAGVGILSGMFKTA